MKSSEKKSWISSCTSFLRCASLRFFLPLSLLRLNLPHVLATAWAWFLTLSNLLLLNLLSAYLLVQLLSSLVILKNGCIQIFLSLISILTVHYNSILLVSIHLLLLLLKELLLLRIHCYSSAYSLTFCVSLGSSFLHSCEVLWIYLLLMMLAFAIISTWHPEIPSNIYLINYLKFKCKSLLVL